MRMLSRTRLKVNPSFSEINMIFRVYLDCRLSLNKHSPNLVAKKKKKVIAFSYFIGFDRKTKALK